MCICHFRNEKGIGPISLTQRHLGLLIKYCPIADRRVSSNDPKNNRPFPRSKKSHFQNEAKCETFVVKMSFTRMKIKTHFHINGFARSLALKVRFFGTRKWPITGNISAPVPVSYWGQMETFMTLTHAGCWINSLR